MRIPMLRRMPVPKRRGLIRIGALVAGAGLLALAFSQVDLTPGYAPLQTALLSGTVEGHYHALAQRLSHRAGAQRGALANVATEGSRENLERLAREGHGSCEAHFALVQDGLAPPENAGL